MELYYVDIYTDLNESLTIIVNANSYEEAEAIAKLENRPYGVIRLAENIHTTCCISTEVIPYLLWAGTDGWESYGKGICKVMQNGAKLLLVKCV